MIVAYGLRHCADTSADTADLEAPTGDLEPVKDGGAPETPSDRTETLEHRRRIAHELKAVRTEGYRRRAFIGPQERMVLELLEECIGGLTVAAIMDELDRSETWVKAALLNLRNLGHVRNEPWHTGAARRPAFIWFAT